MAHTAVPATPDRPRPHTIPMIRLDAPAIVGAVLLGTAATVLLQIAERLDTVLFAGQVVPFGILCLSTAGLVAAFLYGPVAAIITVEINPFFSTLTETGPLAWFWFLNNLLYVFPAGLVMVRLQPMDRWWKWSAASLVGALPAFLALIPIQLSVWAIPLPTALAIFAVHVVWEAIGPATAACLIARAAVRYGLGG
jgi:hypothetical protein